MTSLSLKLGIVARELKTVQMAKSPFTDAK